MSKKGYKQTPEHVTKRVKATSHPVSKEGLANIRATQNTPAIFELMQQYGYSLINKLRSRYHNFNDRCNRPTCTSYKRYGGRGIQNLFTSQLDFLNYCINKLHITTFEQIYKLEIDRIDNDSHYMPGNIRFVTHQENNNNKKSVKTSK